MTVSLRVICRASQWDTIRERIACFLTESGVASQALPGAVPYWKDSRFVLFEGTSESTYSMAEILDQFRLLCDDPDHITSDIHGDTGELALYYSIPEMLQDERKAFVVVTIW